MEERLAPPASLAGMSVKLVVGLFFTALGVLLTLDNLHVVEAGSYLRYWPAVFLVIGLLKLTDETSRVAGVAWMVIGALLLAMTTRIVHFTLFDLFPLFLIGAGAVIVARALGFRSRRSTAAAGRTTVAVLSNRRVVANAGNFTGGSVVAVLGACHMDLTAADIEHGPAVIELLVLMGGVEMRVPDGWDVIGEAVPFMGGIDIKTRSKRTGRQLILRGFVMMGGVDVKDTAARTYAWTKLEERASMAPPSSGESR